VLTRIIHRARPALGATVLTLLAGVAVLPFLGQSLFPHFKERDFLIIWMSRPGTSHAESVRIVTQGSRELRAIPGVRDFGAHIGRAVQGEEINSINFAENWISVDPKASYDSTLAAVEDTAAGYPGLFKSVETYLGERIEEVVAGSSDPIVVRIFGSDFRRLRTEASEVQNTLSTIPGIEGLHTELALDVPHIQVLPNLAKAARVGLKPGDIRRAAATLVAGDEVSDIHRDTKVYDVIVWSVPHVRTSLASVRRLLIDTPSGDHVRLQDVADVRVLPTPNQISREDNSRRIDVSLQPGTRDLAAVVDDVRERLATVKMPLGYHAQLLGELTERQHATRRLFTFGIGAAIGIFLLLQVCFVSTRLAILSFVTLPFALVGGVLAAFGAGGVISLGSLVGFFTVFGIAARNGILLINHYQHLEQEEGEPFGPELVLRGARERLAPILMTALATGLALVPLVISGAIPGAEIEYPMAIVILGGLVTSTLLNLFVVPSLYLRFGQRQKLAV
jgi:Cu/Ag efflux pump CusA